MVFYEDGEPKIDGEGGDLKVRSLAFVWFLTSFYLVLSGWLLFRLTCFAIFGQFRIRTAPHDVFTREGNDIRTTVTITLVLFFHQLCNLAF